MGAESTYCWTGPYLGLTGGYLQSANNDFRTSVNNVFWNQGFAPNALVVSQSLTTAGTRSFSLKQQGSNWGGQLGYLFANDRDLVFGAEADILAAASVKESENYVRQNTFGAAGLNYRSEVEETKDLDYLASIRGKLGYLIRPDILLYGTGGYAFGKASLQTRTSITNTGAPAFAPANTSSNTNSKTLSGWAAGGGLEWAFMDKLSAKVEYMYYDLGDLTTNSPFIYNVLAPNLTRYASANVKSTANFAYHNIRLGINYRFC